MGQPVRFQEFDYNRNQTFNLVGSFYSLGTQPFSNDALSLKFTGGVRLGHES
ncbi:hypothetical protein MES5069_680037 [Mesorhizobium escarrei]|uniref:Uncharacterized protein n=1 Tax=Mesorhizobium escarrei TaxID=666018 RepID=A0ABM9EG50_9HYPH|nr:hypothetical protein MES5069_680037 [Mesorhizobium escarrei]